MPNGRKQRQTPLPFCARRCRKRKAIGAKRENLANGSNMFSFAPRLRNNVQARTLQNRFLLCNSTKICGSYLNIRKIVVQFPSKAWRKQKRSPRDAVNLHNGKEENIMDSKTVTSNVYYSITAKNGLALEIADFNCAAGAAVQLWENANGDSQTWLAVAVADGYFKLENKLSGKVLDVSLGAEANGTQVHVWDYIGKDNQLWRIVDAGKGYFKLVSKQSGKVLDIVDIAAVNGARVQIWEDVNGADQLWKLTAYKAPKAAKPARKTGEKKAVKAPAAPKADKPAPKAEKPAAKADKPAAKAEKPTAKADKPAAKAEKPTPKADKPAKKPASKAAVKEKAPKTAKSTAKAATSK